MKTMVLMLASAVVASGCGVVRIHERLSWGADVQGSGVPAKDPRTVGEFDRIELHGATDVVAKIGPKLEVVVEGDDNILPLITTEVRSGALVIESEKSYSSKNAVRVTIITPNLAGIAIFGAGDAQIDGVLGDRFDVSIRGAGDVTANGEVERVEASITGAGDIDLRNLKTKAAQASISGSGDIVLQASESVDASIQGSGEIRYFGDPPTVKKSILGSGDILRA